MGQPFTGQKPVNGFLISGSPGASYATLTGNRMYQLTRKCTKFLIDTLLRHNKFNEQVNDFVMYCSFTGVMQKR
jgi:hypothetical protein